MFALMPDQPGMLQTTVDSETHAFMAASIWAIPNLYATTWSVTTALLLRQGVQDVLTMLQV